MALLLSESEAAICIASLLQANILYIYIQAEYPGIIWGQAYLLVSVHAGPVALL